MSIKKIICTLCFIFLSFILASCSNNKSEIDNNIKRQSWGSGAPVVVNGDAEQYSLHSLFFVDQKTGWIVKDIYNNGDSYSQLLKTDDAGQNWKVIQMGNTVTGKKGVVLDEIFFIDKNTGWAVSKETAENKQSSNNREFTGDEQSTKKVKPSDDGGLPDTQPYTLNILKTTDGGLNWENKWSENAASDKKSMGIHQKGENTIWFADDSHGYVLIDNKLYSSSDGGSKWRDIRFNNSGNFIPQHISFLQANRGYVIGISSDKNGNQKSLMVMKTDDGGKNWKMVYKEDFPGETMISSIDIDFINDRTGWFLSSNLDTWKGELYYSNNSGSDWEKINDIKCVRPTPVELNFITEKIGWIPLDVGAGPIAGGLLLTEDRGRSFHKINNDNFLSSMGEMQFISTDVGWALGTEPNLGNFLVHTADGGQSWEQVYPPLSPARDISFIDNQIGYGLGLPSDYGALLITDDGGGSWQNKYSFSRDYRAGKISFVRYSMQKTTGITGWCLAADRDNNKLTLLKGIDNGYKWKEVNGNFPEQDLWSVVYFKMFNNNDGIIICNSDTLNFYHTEDGGVSWQKSEQKKLSGYYQFSFVDKKTGYEVFTTEDDYIVNINHVQSGGEIENIGQVTTDAWVYGIDFLSDKLGWILCEEHPFQEDSIVKLLITSDGGRNWAEHPFPSSFKFETLTDQTPIEFADKNHGWIISRWGLLSTRDGGKTWSW